VSKLQTVSEIETTITLKEITDLLSVEHNKAMKKVEELAKEPSFGGVEKMATPTYNPNGSFNRDIQTYKLNKKQAIAVGAKLNNSLLMKLIDKLEDLEKEKQQNFQIPQSYAEALRLSADLAEKNTKLTQTIKNKDDVILAVADLNIKAGNVSFADFAKNLAIDNMGRNNLIKFCKARGYLRDNTEPYQPFVNRGYFVRKPSKEKINGEVRYTTFLTPRGTVWLTKIIKAEFELDDEEVE